MTKKIHEEDFSKYLAKGGLPCIDIKINDNNFVFLIDSGSDISYIDTNIAEDLQLYIKSGFNTDVTTIGNEVNSAPTYTTTLHFSDYSVEADLVGIEVRRTTHSLEVPFDGIIGVDILNPLGASISFSDGKLVF